MFIQKNELAWIEDPNNHNNIQQPQQGTSNGQVLPTFSQTLQQAFRFRRLGPLVALPAGSHGRGAPLELFFLVKKCSETFVGMKF